MKKKKTVGLFGQHLFEMICNCMKRLRRCARNHIFVFRFEGCIVNGHTTYQEIHHENGHDEDEDYEQNVGESRVERIGREDFVDDHRLQVVQ